MSAPPPSAPAASTAAVPIPQHWPPEQALRNALWDAYGPDVQQAWRAQLVPDGPAPEFEPDEPF